MLFKASGFIIESAMPNQRKALAVLLCAGLLHPCVPRFALANSRVPASQAPPKIFTLNPLNLAPEKPLPLEKIDFQFSSRDFGLKQTAIATKPIAVAQEKIPAAQPLKLSEVLEANPLAPHSLISQLPPLRQALSAKNDDIKVRIVLDEEFEGQKVRGETSLGMAPLACPPGNIRNPSLQKPGSPPQGGSGGPGAPGAPSQEPSQGLRWFERAAAIAVFSYLIQPYRSNFSDMIVLGSTIVAVFAQGKVLLPPARPVRSSPAMSTALWAFTLAGAAGLWWYGLSVEPHAIKPWSTFLAFAFYVPFAWMQQYLLQRYLVSKLCAAIVGDWDLPLAIAGAIAFGFCHLPWPAIHALTTIAGFVWVQNYLKTGRLRDITLSHAILATSLFCGAWGIDPMRSLAAFLRW